MKMLSYNLLVLFVFSACTPKPDTVDKTNENKKPFVFISDEMDNQFAELKKHNAFVYQDFENQLKQNPTAGKPFYDKVLLLKKMTANRISGIEAMKTELIALAENISIEEVLSKKLSVKDIEKLDDYDIPTRYFGIDDTSNIRKGRAAQLKKDIASYRDSLLSNVFLISKKDTSYFNDNLNTDDVVNYKNRNIPNAPKEPWEKFYFYHLPMPAAITELTKWQNNILDAERQMLDYLLNEYLKSSK